MINIEPEMSGSFTVPIMSDSDFDLRKTQFLTRHILEWGRLPAQMLAGLDTRRFRYGFIGSDDWSMYPILAPGAMVQVDESKKKIVTHGWSHEADRPLYFLEHRGGFECCWCTISAGQLILQPHGLSNTPSRYFKYPEEVEVLGQVIGVAMRLDQGKRRRTRS